MTDHPLTISRIEVQPTQALSRSMNNPYELILNGYDGCIYLDGNRWSNNYLVEDNSVNSQQSSVIAYPGYYHIVRPNQTIIFSPVSGFINEFIFECAGTPTFSNSDSLGNAAHILWYNGTAPGTATANSVYQYSITYSGKSYVINNVTYKYLGAWAEFKV